MTQITEAIDAAPRPETPPSTTAQEAENRYYTASQFQLMWWKFKKHRLALVGSTVLGMFFFIAAFAEFLSPSGPGVRTPDYLFGSRRFCISSMPRGNFTCARLRMHSPLLWILKPFCLK